jgi:transcriptional regulator with XRE-family HTH domain
MPLERSQPVETIAAGVDVKLPLGAFIRHLRKIRKLTARQVARRVGTTDRNILNLEHRASITDDPHLMTVIGLAGAFHMKPGKFLDELIAYGETWDGELDD